MRSLSDSPWLPRAGLVVAALASLATSEPSWREIDDAVGPGVRLTSAQPEAAFHFNVTSSHPHSVAATVRLVWSPVSAPPTSSVRVSLVPDDGTTPTERVVRPERLPTDTVVEARSGCTGPCEAGYVLRLERVGGADDEAVDASWAVAASIDGDGPGAPRGAFVRVEVD